MKAFFKPTWAKVIIMLLLPLYLGYVVELSRTGGDGSTLVVTFQGWRISPLPYLALFFGALSVFLGDEGFFAALNQFSLGQNLWYFCLEIIVPLMINYLLACFFVWLYHRAFPKRKSASTQPPPAEPPTEEGMEL